LPLGLARGMRSTGRGPMYPECRGRYPLDKCVMSLGQVGLRKNGTISLLLCMDNTYKGYTYMAITYMGNTYIHGWLASAYSGNTHTANPHTGNPYMEYVFTRSGPLSTTRVYHWLELFQGYAYTAIYNSLERHT
jgi:hypothetical protein